MRFFMTCTNRFRFSWISNFGLLNIKNFLSLSKVENDFFIVQEEVSDPTSWSLHSSLANIMRAERKKKIFSGSPCSDTV